MMNDPCEFCDGVIEETVTRVPFHYQREIIYVNNVPVRRCVKCGEIYFDAAVYTHLERIAEGRKRIKSKISFPLANYRKAPQPEVAELRNTERQTEYEKKGAAKKGKAA